MGARPPSLLPAVFQDAAVYLIMFFSGWEQELASSEEVPPHREPWVPGGRQNVSRAPSSQSSRTVHVWLAASITEGGRRAGGARPAMLSGYLICSPLGRAALRVCLQLQPVLIIRSEYSSP